MLKKYPNSTFVIVFCLIVSVVDIYNNLLWFSQDYNTLWVKAIIDPLNLDWVFARNFTMNINGHNYINLTFEILLLIGTILYAGSKQKETRLLRFVVSVIFLSNVLAFMNGIYWLVFMHHKLFDIKHTLIYAVFCVVNLFWVLLSYKILTYFNLQKELQIDIYGEGESVVSHFSEASKGQRFLNILFDIPVAIMLFSPMMRTFIYIHYPPQATLFGFDTTVNNNTYLILIIISRLIYYLIFEAIFGATPGKFLTETRVINHEGSKPPFKNIAIRTLSRLIPFEAVSFFTHSGLHDKLSQTLVVKEKNSDKLPE